MASHINKTTCSQQDQVHLRTPSAAFHRSCTVEPRDAGENINLLFQKVQRFATKFDPRKSIIRPISNANNKFSTVMNDILRGKSAYSHCKKTTFFQN